MNAFQLKIVDKPWGQEEIIEVNSSYVVKRLTMHVGQRCSLQYHERKRETIYVVSGLLKITTGTELKFMIEKIYSANSFITIEPMTIHRMEGIEETVYLEASTTELDDVVRLEDDYQRD